MSRSRSVILLPLSCPGERRYEVDNGEEDNDNELVLSEKTKFLKKQTNDELTKFRDKWITDSQSQQYRPNVSYTNLPVGMACSIGIARVRSGNEVEWEAGSNDEGGGFYERREVLWEGYGSVETGVEVFEAGCHEGDECEVKVVEYWVVYTHSLRWLVGWRLELWYQNDITEDDIV